MSHSGGGAAMDIFDPVTPLCDWVEKGQAPTQRMATSGRFKGRTRPNCAWPQIARHTGSGSVDSAENFRCTAP